jgi:uncharacterized protein DUF5681
MKCKSESRLKTGTRKAPRTAFKPGRSGNPGGRPKLSPEQKVQRFELVKACRSKSPQALAVIEQLMHRADRDSVRLEASLIVERGWGKAGQPNEPSEYEEAVSRPFRVQFVSANPLPAQSQIGRDERNDDSGDAWPTS